MGRSINRELVALLKESGCSFVRHGKGSHEVWFSPLTRRHFAVPSNIESHVTANAILRQAGLEKAF